MVGSIVGSTSAPTTPIGTVRDQNHLDDINENDDSHLGSLKSEWCLFTAIDGVNDLQFVCVWMMYSYGY